jgi:hypothetical protein
MAVSALAMGERRLNKNNRKAMRIMAQLAMNLGIGKITTN